MVPDIYKRCKSAKIVAWKIFIKLTQLKIIAFVLISFEINPTVFNG